MRIENRQINRALIHNASIAQSGLKRVYKHFKIFYWPIDEETTSLLPSVRMESLGKPTIGPAYRASRPPLQSTSTSRDTPSSIPSRSSVPKGRQGEGTRLLFCLLLASGIKKTPEGFVGDLGISGNLTQEFAVLTDTNHYIRLFMRGKAIF